MDTASKSSTPENKALPLMSGWDAPETEEEEFLSPETEEQPGPRRGRWRLALLLLATLLAGAAAGGLLVRQRFKAQQVVASVNGVLIKEPDFLHQMEIVQGNTTIQKMVSEELQLQYARKMGVFPSDTEVSARYNKMKEQPNFGQYLATTHQNSEDVLHSIRVSLAEAALLSKGSDVTEAEMRAYYDQQTSKRNPLARFYTPPAVTISVIINRSRPELDKALHALQAGESFAEVAAKYSQDASRVKGGILPPVLKGRTPSSRIPGAEDTVFSLAVGQQAGPKFLANQWWIIRCLDKKPEVLMPYEQVKAECREGALIQKGLSTRAKQVHEEYINFEKNANVQAFWPQYRYVIGNK